MHGKLTAIIQYWLRYETKNERVILSFGLGADVAVNSIIGLPTLRQWGGNLDFNKNSFVTTHIHTCFPLHYEPEKSLPPDENYTNPS